MMDVQQAVQQKNMELRKLLTQIDYYYSRVYHLRMLRFLAQAVAPYEQLKSCESVPEIYDKIVDSVPLRGSESAVAVALLRYMLCVTGYKREDKLRQLHVYCSEEFELPSRFPLLPFFERLLVLSSKLLEGGRFKRFWSSVDENKLNRSKLDVKSSPLDLFQSMIFQRTLDPNNYSTIMEEVVPLLEQCEMAEEAQQVLGSSTDGEVDSARMYFNFKGRCSHDPDCMRPLLTSREELKCWRCLSAASLEKVTCGIKVSCSLTFLVVFIAAVLLIFAMPRLPEHTQIQPFEGLGSLIYAPFPNISIDGFYYNQMKVTTAVGSKNDFNNFNLTVCNVLCPLETVSNHLPTVKEASLNDRKSSNWYVNLRGWSSPVDSSSQYNSLYMLKGSLLTFSIIRLVPLTDVQLCITNSIHVCSEVYNNASNSVKAHQVCQEVLIFNKTNDHVRTFTARDTSYYCAVWVLKAYNQSLNYTVNRTIQSYKISTGPPSQCQTHKKQTKTQSFDLQRQIAIKSSPVCIVIQVAGNQLPNNITLVSTIVSSKTNNILFVLGAVFSCLSVLMFVIVLVMVCLVACEKLLTI